MGNPSKILFNRNVRGPLSNCSNDRMDIQEQIERKLQKAEELANKKGRYNCEEFETGDKVYIQDPTTKKLTKEAEISYMRKYNRKPRCYILLGSDGADYLRNRQYLQLKPSPGTESIFN